MKNNLYIAIDLWIIDADLIFIWSYLLQQESSILKHFQQLKKCNDK